jgi:hypothetical protein
MAEDHMGDPAQAFEDLRAEVSVLRRAIEALPATIRENRPADYSADLAVLGKGLDEIGEQLGTILKSSALMVSPQEQGKAIAKAGHNLVREAAEKLNLATHAMERERGQLAGIVGQAWAQDRQYKLLFLTAGIAVAVGLVFSPLVAGVLPFGLNTRVAALVMRADRWTAGGDLMKAGNPAAWARLDADTGLVADNREAVDTCRETAAKTGKAQRCSLNLAPPKDAGATATNTREPAKKAQR